MPYRRSTAIAILSLLLDVQAQKRIVGGNQATFGEFPFFVDIGGCGASLIAPGIILTAAHCSDNEEYIGRTVSVGAYQHGGGLGSKKSKVVDSILHPQYDSMGINYDYALFRLEDKITLASNVVLKLNQEDAFPAIGQNLTVIGLGARSEEEDGSMPLLLHEVEIQAIDHKVCNRQYEGKVEQQSMFCAGVDGGGKDSCQGDSGGPLFIRNGTEHIQVGIVSWGQGCARNGYPGVYARISHVYDWIRKIACGCWQSDSETLCKDFVDKGDECPTAPPVFVPDPDCNDLAGYMDEFGDSCGWYQLNDDPGCSVYGDITGGPAFEGIKPLEACCHCGGGGVRTPTLSPSPTNGPLPTPSPTSFFVDPDCTDYEGYVDTYGDDCQWYAQFDDPGCPVEGNTLGGDGFEDVTSSQACCICGGGGERDPTAAPGPTTPPTPEATFHGPNCKDYPGWKDSYKDGCDWYREHDSAGCPTHGQEDGGTGFTGISASKACCYCGGGTENANPFAKPPTYAPTVFSIDNNCQDVPGFQDFCGDDCSWYEGEDSPGCPEWGDLVGTASSSNNQIEAKVACCYCGGGTAIASVQDSPNKPTPVPEPTDTPTAFATDPDCLDLTEFVDYFGDSCDWYRNHDDPGCILWGSHQGGKGFENFTAKTACCYCGGGISRGGAAANQTIGGEVNLTTNIATVTSTIAAPTSSPVATNDDETLALNGKRSAATYLELSLLLPCCTFVFAINSLL